MTKKKDRVKNGQHTIEFLMYAPDAGSVCVSGDFNDWDTEGKPMKKNRMGVWEKKIKLSPGTHEYKYIVDHKWCEDPKNGCCLNVYGTYNNVVEVPEK